jgi:O-antigen/teichoic acid export membrane protein
MTDGKRTAVRLLGMNMLSTGLTLLLSVPNRLISAYFLGPAGLGILKITEVIQQYASYTDLGLTRTLPRQVPIALGANDFAEAEQIKRIVFSGNVISCTVGVLLLGLLFILGIDFKGALDWTVMLLIILTFIANRAGAYLNSYARASGEFDSIGLQSIVTSLTNPVFAWPLIVLLQVKGALIGQLIVSIVVVAFYLKHLKGLQFRFTLPLRKTCQLVKIGFLIFVNQFTDTLFWTVDATLLAWLLLPSEVGQYAFAMGVLNLAVTVPTGLRHVVFREMLLKRGEHGVERSWLGRYLEGPHISYLILTAMILAGAYFGYSAIVSLFLPDFLPAIPIAAILVFGHLVFASTYITSLYFNVTDQLVSRAVVTGLCLGFNTIIDWLLLSSGYGLMGVAFGSTVSYLLFSSILVLSAVYQTTVSRLKSVLFLARLLMVTSILFILLEWLSHLQLVSFQENSQHWLNIIAGLCDGGFKAIMLACASIVLYSAAFWQHRPYRNILFATDYLSERMRSLSLAFWR